MQIEVTADSSFVATGGVFSNNFATGHGGGIYSAARRTTIGPGVRVTGNRADGKGGGIAIMPPVGEISCHANVFSSTITKNLATSAAGLMLHTCDSQVTGTHLEDNAAQQSAGGMQYSGAGSGHLTLSDCMFARNDAQDSEAEGGGGGLLFEDGDIDVAHCHFHNNTAPFGLGGGLNVKGSPSPAATWNLHDSTFLGNFAVDGGGAVFHSNRHRCIQLSTEAHNVIRSS